jgi:hypothetical protein
MTCSGRRRRMRRLFESCLVPCPALILKIGDLPAGGEHSVPKRPHTANYGIPFRLGRSTQRQQASPHLTGHARDRVLQLTDLCLNLRSRNRPPHSFGKTFVHLISHLLAPLPRYSLSASVRAPVAGNTRAPLACGNPKIPQLVRQLRSRRRSIIGTDCWGLW